MRAKALLDRIESSRIEAATRKDPGNVVTSTAPAPDLCTHRPSHVQHLCTQHPSQVQHLCTYLAVANRICGHNEGTSPPPLVPRRAGAVTWRAIGGSRFMWSERALGIGSNRGFRSDHEL